MKAYHFTTDKLRDGRPIPKIGVPLIHDGPIIPCHQGLHASEHPFDALQFAPGNLLHLVELDGDLIAHGNPCNKWIGRTRTIIQTIDATVLLRRFAKDQALSVIHLWDAPQVVIDYLNADADCADADAAAHAAARAAARAEFLKRAEKAFDLQ